MPGGVERAVFCEFTNSARNAFMPFSLPGWLWQVGESSQTDRRTGIGQFVPEHFNEPFNRIGVKVVGTVHHAGQTRNERRGFAKGGKQLVTLLAGGIGGHGVVP